MLAVDPVLLLAFCYASRVQCVNFSLEVGITLGDFSTKSPTPVWRHGEQSKSWVTVCCWHGHSISRTQFFSPMGVAKLSFSEAQSDGKAFLWSKCDYWQFIQYYLPITASYSVVTITWDCSLTENCYGRLASASFFTLCNKLTFSLASDI